MDVSTEQRVSPVDRPRGAARHRATIALSSLPVLAGAAGAAMLWQHLRYGRVRRTLVHEDQRLGASRGGFHVLMFLTVAPGADVIEELRVLRRVTRSSGAAWIYAGKAVAAPRYSAQIGEKEWSAVVLLEFPSRAAYDRHAESEGMSTALGRFQEAYLQGFQRFSGLSAMFPQLLLAMRAVQIVGRRPSHFPFTPTRNPDVLQQADQLARRLRKEMEFGAHAIVIVNLIKRGTREQQAADRRYRMAMFGAMAEGGYGPLHLGRAVRIERNYEFDMVALVYYPGIEFFVDMIRSEYFQAIIGDKQLGDTQAVITVPILDRL
ncbi:hypothetical protein [Mycobacterium spongiae]|uniref:DUF1330 domain-containing protein n=1 Tax=Mycobacterium spongiae TaxID=886343 RepID=A0A975JYQ4_9MYCO|nr:hypothetical protein [Mycobacterium spongiae]QUR68162.1 hypothetical protein F6B93_14700 [Mycobacterium spongiae]